MTSKIQSVLIPKEKSKLHAVNFPKTGFTLKQSHKWLLDHDFKLPKKVDETINFYRYRQKLPDKRYTYTTKVLSNGVELVLMWKKPFIKIGGVKRQVYTPEPDSNITQTALNNAIATLKPWRVFQLKELIQKYSESKNLNIKYKVSKRIKLIETILKFNINPNEYEISQINPKQPVPANVLKKYGLKPNNDDEQRRYEEELRNELEKDGKMTKSPLLAKAEYITKEGLLEKVLLQEHQEKFIKQFIFSNLRGAIVFHGVGTGKTLTAVVASYFYLIMYPTHKVVVISPSALLYNFINGMRQFGINPTDNRYKYLTYEKYINSQRSKNPIKTKDSLLIIDEAHNFRTEIIKVEIRDPETDEVIGYDSIKNKRGQTILSRGAIYAHKVLLLTGTPFVNTIYDIENLLAMVEKRDPLTKLQFFNMLTIPENISDYFNYKISYQPVIDSSFFPRMIPHIEGIYMTDQQESLYNQIKNIGKFELGDEGEIVPLNDTDKPNSYFSAERYATNAIDKENNPKINRILELVKEKPTQKFIIYTALQDAGIKLLEKKLTSNQISFKVISGSESTSQKEESRRYFNGFYSSEIPKSNDAGMLSYTNDKYRVLLITKAGTEGVDTVNCHNLILLDHQWNDASTEQIIARAIRFKSHHALPVSERYVNVYTLLFVFKKEEPYITRLNEPGFNDYIGLKNDVSEPSNQSKDIQNKIKNATKSINNIKLRLEEDKLKGKSEQEIKKLVISEFTKLINRSIESMPEIKKELEEMKIYIDKQFEELQKKQKYTGMIEVGHKSSRQGIGKKWSADTRKEITYSNYVSNYLVSYIIEGFKNLIDKKVDFGELDTLNVSIDLKLFLLSKSKQKNINEFVSKIGNEITIFEKYETKLLPLIMKKELELKRELTDAEQIDIYREFLLKEDQNALKNKFVPSLETIGKNKRMTQDVKQQFFTQLELANEIANLGLDGLKGQIEILEPTAGSGGLIQPLIQNLITNKDIIFKVDMIEIDNKNRIILKELEKASPNILNLLDNKNFLTIVRKQYYDIILMNPPFHLNGKENGLLKDTYDWEFMRRAFSFLKVGGSLVCISSTSWSFGIQYKRFMAEFPILQEATDNDNYGQRLKEGYDITGDTKYCDYEIYRKTSKFKGSEGKDTSNEMPIDVFKLTKLSNELDNDILNTVFYRKVEKEAEELENNNIDLDNDIKPPPPPKPSQGGAINKKELKSFVEAGYKKKKDVQNIDGYILDKELSTKRDKIYYDPKTKKSVHVIAGTDNLKDWSNNLLIPFGLHHLSNRYKNSEEAQKKANAKYGKNNVSVVSHSQSGNIADNLAKRDLVGDENITLNPAIIGSPNKKVKVVKSFFDPVSYFTKTKKGDEVLMPSSLNPLKEHSPQILEGKGRFKKK